MPRLTLSRTIRAVPARLFDAWTDPEQLIRWWGPAGVECVGARVDLRVGGDYQLDNRLADGSVITITGRFVVVERPARLVYTWSTDGGTTGEQVTVRFEPLGEGRTRVEIVHDRIADPAIADRHRMGWAGCLDGLAVLLR